jgi:ABC-type bacteriocin/lantibiotic exporter with double-glycine peptidase domain
MRKILPFPNNQQANDFHCGPGVAQSILFYYGYDLFESVLARRMNTNKNGSTPESIIKLFKKFKDIKLELRSGISFDEIKREIDKKNPILVIIQAYPKNKKINHQWEDYWNYGHFVVIIGYDDMKKLLFFEDPCSFVTRFLSYEEFKKRWRNKEPTTKKKYVNWAVVFKGKPKFSEKILKME